MSLTKASLVDLGRQAASLKDEKNPNSRLRLYESMAKLITSSKTTRAEIQPSLQVIDFPVILQDIANSANDSLAVSALGFLGALLQLVKLPVEKQEDVIRFLTSKVTTPQDKNLSRKVMWSLANLEIDFTLSEEFLSMMLTCALGFLDEIKKPPIASLSTVCESINTLSNLSNRRKDFFVRNLHSIVSSMSPWLFFEADRIRQLSLMCLEPYASHIASGKLFDASFQAQLKERHRNELMRLVQTESQDGLNIWSFLIRGFGTLLHDSVPLLNDLLKVEESALKSRNPVFRQAALERWRSVIDCFALTPAVLNNSKRIKLVLVPLKSTDSRTPDFARTKIQLWLYLLERLGPDVGIRFIEVTLPLLAFCFGNLAPPTKGTALVFEDVMPFATSVLASVLSPDKNFSISIETAGDCKVTRSHVLLTMEEFQKSFSSLSHYLQLVLTHRPASDTSSKTLSESIKSALHSFLDRCGSSEELKEPFKTFMRPAFELIVNRSDLMGPAFEILAEKLTNRIIMEVLSETTISILFKWYTDNEPLPTHPSVQYLNQFFEAGLVWNAPVFSSAVCDALVGLQNGAIGLWIKYASALVAQSGELNISSLDKRPLLFPLKGSMLESNGEEVLFPWCSLFNVWMKVDPDALSASLNPSGNIEVEADIRCARFVLKALKGELAPLCAQLMVWVRRWIETWISRTNQQKDRSGNSGLLADFLLLLLDETDKATCESLHKVACDLLQQQQSDVQEALLGIFGPATATVRTPAIQKLRKNSKVLKMFADLLQRSKSKAKQTDDFVVVPPPAKPTKRVLTEHQKEVSRSKRRSSTVPALYNDLSQSSQQTQLESCTMDAHPEIPVVASSSVILPEEDAHLEPPSLKTNEKECEILASPTTDKENPPSSSPTINELLKNDHKLNSKACVRIEIIAPRRSTRKSLSSGSTSQASSPVADESFTPQRPCPKSKKVGYSSKKTFSPAEKIDESLPPKRSPTDHKVDLEGPVATPKEPLTKPIDDNVDVAVPVPPVMDSPAKAIVFDESHCGSLTDPQPDPMLPEKAAQEANPSTQEHTLTEHATEAVVDRQMMNVPASMEVETSSASPVINDCVPNDRMVEGTVTKDITEMSTDEEEPNTKIPDLIPINKQISTSPALTEDTPIESDMSFRHPEETMDTPIEQLDEGFIPKGKGEPPAEDATSEVVVASSSTNQSGTVITPVELPEATPSQEIAGPLDPNVDLKEKIATQLAATVSSGEILAPVDETSAVEIEATTESDAAASQITSDLRRRKVHLQMKSGIISKTYQSTSKSGRKRSASGGLTQSHSTSKRGAQILELSRQKIQGKNGPSNGEIPPGKKAKLTNDSTPDLNTLSEPLKASTSMSLIECVVVTPESSPARKVPWTAKTYSPYASPSTGILKKKSILATEEGTAGSEEYSVENSPISSASKARRVSFADPEVSHSVKISPARARTKLTRSSSNRLRRSLIISYGQNASDDGTPVNGKTETFDVEMNESVAPSEMVLEEEEEAVPLPADDPVVENLNNTIGSELAAFVCSALPQDFSSSSQSISVNEPMDASIAEDSAAPSIEKLPDNGSPNIQLEAPIKTPDEEDPNQMPESCPNAQVIQGQEITPLNSECSSSSVTVTVDSSPPTMLDTPEDSNDAPISAEGGSQSGSIPLPENVKAPVELPEDEMLDQIERHSKKEEILAAIFRRYFTVAFNGKSLKL